MTETSLTGPEHEYWEGRYQEHEHIWTGKPNALLVREIADLPPGTALDLGCGEGGDAIWLARQGWRVTAVDISATALRRGAEHAAGLDIVWAQHDLSQTFPAGLFDLVSAQFFHSVVAPPVEREKALRRAADAVAPGGLLLIVGHAGWPTWVEHPPFDFDFPTTRQVLDSLGVAGRWEVELEDVVETEVTGPEGQPGRRADNVLRVRRPR
jgi:SAM-dependent methyltransferase